MQEVLTWCVYNVYNKDMNSKEIIKKLKADGWFEIRQKGSHLHLRHPRKPGTTTVVHPKKDTPLGTLRAIEKQSGVTLRKDK